MEIVVQQTLPKPVENFLNVLAGQAKQFGEKFGAVFKKLEMAEGTGKDVKTITSYLKQLEEADLIEMSTKRGKHGGVTILFNDKILKFEQKEAPFFAETKTLKELEEYFYPQFKRPEPKRKYRPKSEILAEKAFKSKARAEQDRLNAILADSDYPTREFFLQTEDPLLYTRAYLASRMYNAYTVIYPEIRKNNAERRGDIEAFSKASFQTVTYKSYDCLPKAFIGTSTFTCFLNLVNFLEAHDASPLPYLTAQFNLTQHLDSKQDRPRLPFINALYGDGALERYKSSRQFMYKGRYKDGRTIEKGDDYMNIVGRQIPIITLLKELYEEPFATKTPFDNVINLYDVTDPFSTMSLNNKERKLLQYYHVVMSKIETSDLLDREKTVLSNYMKQQVASHMGSDALVSPQYLLANVASMLQIRKDFEESGETNYRKYYESLGNTAKRTEYTKLEQAGFVKRGYLLDLSIHGNDSLYYVTKTMQSLREFNIDPELFNTAWSKFGKQNLPVNKAGMLNMNTLYEKLLTEEELVEDREAFEGTTVYLNKSVDDGSTLWYDVLEDTVGDSLRDGRSMLTV